MGPGVVQAATSLSGLPYPSFSRMAGRPMMAALNSAVARLAIPEQGLTGEDVFFSRLADAEPVGKLARELGCGRSFLYLWRDQAAHRERRRPLWEAAMKASAEVEAEKGARILKKLSKKPFPTPADVALARARADYHKWMASVRDREAFGTGPQIQVNLTVGELHLDALRVAGRALPKALPLADVVDAEIEPVEDGDECSNA